MHCADETECERTSQVDKILVKVGNGNGDIFGAVFFANKLVHCLLRSNISCYRHNKKKKKKTGFEPRRGEVPTLTFNIEIK